MSTPTIPYASRERICVSHYPLPETPPQQSSLAALMELDQPNSRPGQNAMYVHIPFCDKICNFCPFNKQLMDEAKMDAYLLRLNAEVARYAGTRRVSSMTFGSLAIGGGTPSCMTAGQMAGFLERCQDKLRFADDAEFSIEGNPSNFTYEKLVAARAAGCNRISFGVQTFNDSFAATLEIPQEPETSREATRLARKAGYDNVGIDLIYNLPGQTVEQWRADVQEAIDWRYDHVTLFSLIIPPFTRLHSLIDTSKLARPGDHEHEVTLYRLASQMLRDAGYEQYSVYDFALPGKINKHAVLYFSEQRDLLGVGAAAFGYLGRYMYVNKGPLAEYEGCVDDGGLPVLIGSKADRGEEMCGQMAKGLRLFSVDRHMFRELFDRDAVDVFADQVARLTAQGLLTVTDDAIALTEEGVFWGNNVCREFFSERFAQVEAIPREVLARGRLLKEGQKMPKRLDR
ncbi:radical SAM family heme chaperone HemW [Amycolatopsis sp. NBC_00348]|uniref:radical SAM family heme chaperone HemW n=1 Tax=Amycolatopsis sp. NBC_00348 TaxID=2975956 RepID=UPI002E259928